MRAILGTIALEPNRWTPYREPRTDLITTLPAIHAAGFDKLEIWQWHIAYRGLAAVRDLKERGDELGVSFPYIGAYPSFVGTGADHREQLRLQADVLDKAEILGTRNLKVMLGCGIKGSSITAAQMQLTVERFGTWFREAKTRGIAMCVELHGNTMFDPVEAGMAFMQAHPELGFSICFQAYDFADTDKALALADQFAGRITHIHLQAPRDGLYDLLEHGALDYRRLLPHIVKLNPATTMTLEFIKDCIPAGPPFDLELVLANARRDAEFVERVLG